MSQKWKSISNHYSYISKYFAVAITNTSELDQKLIYCSFYSIQKAFNKQYNWECPFSGCENDMKQSSLTCFAQAILIILE